jgi:hypothetical protein
VTAPKRKSDFTAFDRELIAAKEKGQIVRFIMAEEGGEYRTYGPYTAVILVVDRYFIKIAWADDAAEEDEPGFWINKAAILRAEIGWQP